MLAALRLRLTNDSAGRRRLQLLGIACVVALVTGTEFGSRAVYDPQESVSTAAEEPVNPATELSLRQQVGQLLILSFDGTEQPTYVEDALRAAEVSGVILFGENIVDEGQLEQLTGDLQQSSGGSALISADQEGGEIRTVPFAAPETSPAAITEPRTAQQAARDAGRDLSALGINVNLAPVADVASVEGSVMAGRAYPGEAEQVAALVAAAIQGHEQGGVASTAKHFPGLGAATENTDDTSVEIERTVAELAEIDLVPFGAAIQAGTPLVMMSHALYPDIDRRQIASQSPVMIEDLLRGELGYDGVVITDSLEAQAVLDQGGEPEQATVDAALASTAAGADLMLMTSAGSYERVFEAMLAEAEGSEDFAARVEESAGRVLELKQRLGLELPVAL